MKFIIVACFLLLAAGISADIVPQQFGFEGPPRAQVPHHFGFGGQSKAQTPPSLFDNSEPIFPTPDPELLIWPQKIQDLVDLTRTTLTSMGEIALADDPDVGARIVNTLKGEITKAAQILADYFENVAKAGRLRKREASNNGEKPYNEVGEVLVGSNKKIDSDKTKLNPGAQKKINKKYREGIRKCQADSCKAAAAAITGAEDAEDERE